MARPGHDNGILHVGCSLCAVSPGGDPPSNSSLSGRATWSVRQLHGLTCMSFAGEDLRGKTAAMRAAGTCSVSEAGTITHQLLLLQIASWQ